MTNRPWESEPDSLDFEAEGLPCKMRRGGYDAWCGYVGIGSEHPLYGLPTNHPLKLPSSWFDGRKLDQGLGPMDLFIHMLGAKSMDDSCPISIAFHVHGGVDYADDHVPHQEPDGRWWFGFDCGHAGDYLPGLDMRGFMTEMIDSMPEHVRDTMRGIMAKQTNVYRDQQYVVSECQSLAAQLNAVVGVLQMETTHGRPDHRHD
jgi:hypothetical protein